MKSKMRIAIAFFLTTTLILWLDHDLAVYLAWMLYHWVMSIGYAIGRAAVGLK